MAFFWEKGALVGRAVSGFGGTSAFPAWVYHTHILPCCCSQSLLSHCRTFVDAYMYLISVSREVWSPLLGAEGSDSFITATYM
jgi:hypothetical protein